MAKRRYKLASWERTMDVERGMVLSQDGAEPVCVSCRYSNGRKWAK